jgi:hypothetical protein
MQLFSSIFTALALISSNLALAEGVEESLEARVNRKVMSEHEQNRGPASAGHSAHVAKADSTEDAGGHSNTTSMIQSTGPSKQAEAKAKAAAPVKKKAPVITKK